MASFQVPVVRAGTQLHCCGRDISSNGYRLSLGLLCKPWILNGTSGDSAPALSCPPPPDTSEGDFQHLGELWSKRSSLYWESLDLSSYYTRRNSKLDSIRAWRKKTTPTPTTKQKHYHMSSICFSSRTDLWFVHYFQLIVLARQTVLFRLPVLYFFLYFGSSM